MNCSVCGKEIDACEHCNTLFAEDDGVICSDAHVHEGCFEDWIKTTRNWELGEVILTG